MAEKPLVVGLTGQTGAGQTTVSEAVRKNGYAVINADLVSREVTADPYIARRLGELFGADVLSEDGTLNRKALGEKVFSDPNELLKLNTILHPIIVKRIQEKIGDLAKSGKTRILLDAPTLFESGADKLCTRTVAVLADEEVRRRRIMERDHLTEEEALRRIKAQHPESYYRVRSSYSLRNNGTPEQLEKEAQPIIDRLEKAKNSSLRSLLVLTAAFVGVVLFIWGAFLGIFHLQYPQKYEDAVEKSAAEYQVAPSLVYALMKSGSGLDADYAEDGRQGILPLTEEQLAEVSGGGGEFESLLSPEESIRWGAAYLGQLSEEFSTERAVIAAYCAGEEQVREWLADPDCSEDGADLTAIPDEDVREFVSDAEGALFMYRKLYQLE